jgi:hypothetical protein
MLAYDKCSHWDEGGIHQEFRQPRQKRMTGLEIACAMQTSNSVEIAIAAGKQRSPLMIETVPIIELGNEAAETADRGPFLFPAHGEISIEHSVNLPAGVKLQGPGAIRNAAINAPAAAHASEEFYTSHGRTFAGGSRAAREKRQSAALFEVMFYE